MLDSQARKRFVDLYPTVAAAIAVVAAPLLALSYFAIPDGAGELKTGTVSAWADPARNAAGRLLTFASHDRVYATYTQLFALLFPAVLLVAWLSWRQRRAAATRAERWTWRVVLTGYLLIGVGLVAVSFVLIAASPSSAATNDVFLPFIAPGILLATIGSSVLGIMLLRDGFRPRVASWLLALGFPLWIVGSDVVGHNGVGLVPLFVAWAAASHRVGAMSVQPTQQMPSVETAAA
jgi:hypothetical protein